MTDTMPLIKSCFMLRALCVKTLLMHYKCLHITFNHMISHHNTNKTPVSLLIHVHTATSALTIQVQQQISPFQHIYKV
jgi:hypothetical protein